MFAEQGFMRMETPRSTNLLFRARCFTPRPSEGVNSSVAEELLTFLMVGDIRPDQNP
jgi:hypothetical protein